MGSLVDLMADLSPIVSNSTLDSVLIDQLEADLGTLPSQYIDLLRSANGQDITFGNFIHFKGLQPSCWASNSYDAFDEFYGLLSLRHEIEVCKEDLGAQWIPIGGSTGGNHICLCVKGPMTGQLWFWDHEQTPDFDVHKVESGMYLAADTLLDFVKKLEVNANENENVIGVLSCELDF